MLSATHEQTLATRLKDPARASSVMCVRSAEELAEHIEAWEKLASVAAEPNPFYEHWMLIPALRLLAAGQDVSVLLVFHPNPAAGGRLIGVLPVQRVNWPHRMPIGALRSWRYRHCFLATPLVAADAQREFWHLLFKWACDNASVGVLELPHLAIDGPVYAHLLDSYGEQPGAMQVVGQYGRAMMRLEDPDHYAQRTPHLRETRRKYARRRRKLAEEGHVTVHRLGADEQAIPYLQAFMQVEAGGWKGRSGTALACDIADRNFFSAICERAHQRKRLTFLRMDVDSTPIASEINVHAGEGVFSLKTAYDERFAKYSPGMLLTMEATAILHEDGRAKWVDACASSRVDPVKCIWDERRLIGTVICPLPHRFGGLITAALPLAHHLCQRGRSLIPRLA